jgi:hypothetical protein
MASLIPPMICSDLTEDFISFRLETPAAVVDGNPSQSIRAYGPGLRQAQVGVQTSFTIDTHATRDGTDDVKVLVTSKQTLVLP